MMKKLPLHTKILFGLLAGIVIGLIFGEKATFIKPIGTIFIKMITMIVVPLVLFSLMIGTASLGDIKKLGRIGLKTFIYFIITTIIAISIGLTMGNIFTPGKGLSAATREEIAKSSGETPQAINLEKIQKKPSAVEILVDIIPSNPVKSLTEGNMLQVIFIALLFGTALTMIKKEKAEPLMKIIDGANDVAIQVVHLAMKIAPFGVMALIASVIGQFGLHMLVLLLKYAALVIIGLSIHAFFINGMILRFLGGMNPLTFFKAVKEAILIAFSTSSSNAALPVAMDNVSTIGVRKEFSSFVIPLGTTINMDGTALYQGVSAIFIAQIYGINLGLGDQLTIILMAVLASIGTAGVPAAGVIMLVMVLKQIGIPIEGISLILGVERILDMCRTTTNTIGNMTTSVVIQKLEKVEFSKMPI